MPNQAQMWMPHKISYDETEYVIEIKYDIWILDCRIYV